MSFPRVATLVLVLGAAAADECSWCEAGACDVSVGNVTKAHFNTSITAAVGGRAFPYWRPAGQPELGAPAATAELAVIVHHGAGRNADDYCRYMMNSVRRAGLGATALVFAPQVYEAADAGLDAARELWWDASDDDGLDDARGARDWKWGGNSTAELGASLSTFSVLDELVGALADAAAYPRLARVVVAGHSAGGQIAQRYALFSRLAPPPFALEVVVANPSSVTYLDARRPALAAPRTCGFCDNATIANATWAFAAPAAGLACAATYDDYGYGLGGAAALPDYPAATGADAARAQYAARRVTYASGSSDVCDAPYMTAHDCVACRPDDGGLDGSCEADAQGYCRMARLHAFAQYVHLYYGERNVSSASHRLVAVPGVGHSGCAMFQSAEFTDAVLLSPQARA